MIDLVVCCGGRSCGPIMNNLSGLSWFNQLYSYTLKIVAIILSQVSSSMSPTATVETTENGFKTNIRLDGEGGSLSGHTTAAGWPMASFGQLCNGDASGAIGFIH